MAPHTIALSTYYYYNVRYNITDYDTCSCPAGIIKTDRKAVTGARSWISVGVS